MAGNIIEYFTPSRAGLIANQTIDVFSPEMLGYEMLGFGALPVADVAPGANLVIHHPLVLPSPFVVSQFFWINGGTVNGNTDIGVYSEAGAALLLSTGATLNSGASALQAVNITDFTLPANQRLWLSIGTDSGTHEYSRFTLTAPVADYTGIKTMAAGLSGSALVVPATFAIGANTCIRCGMTGASVI